MAIDFEIPAEAKAVRETVRQWVHDECIPAEQRLLDGEDYKTVLGQLRTKARSQGLWCPFIPKEYGGMQLGPLNRGNGRELIVSGWSNDSAFSAGDFHAFSSTIINVGAVYVYREGNGIRVKFERDDGMQGGFCTDNLGGFEGGCLGGWAGGTRVTHELANWDFDDCR